MVLSIASIRHSVLLREAVVLIIEDQKIGMKFLNTFLCTTIDLFKS